MTRPTNELDHAVTAALPFVLKEPMDIGAALDAMESVLRVKVGPERLEAARDACRDALRSSIGLPPKGALFAFGCTIMKDIGQTVELATARL